MVCGDVWIWMLLCWVGVLDDDGLLRWIESQICVFKETTGNIELASGLK